MPGNRWEPGLRASREWGGLALRKGLPGRAVSGLESTGDVSLAGDTTTQAHVSRKKRDLF